jgi:hypothetical protein
MNRSFLAFLLAAAAALGVPRPDGAVDEIPAGVFAR